MLVPVFMESWTAIRKALRQCSDDTSSCPGPYPTAVCPDFHIGCRLSRELFILLVCWYRFSWSHGLQSERLYPSVAVTPVPFRVPTLLPLVTSHLVLVVLITLPCCAKLGNFQLDYILQLLSMGNAVNFLVEILSFSLQKKKCLKILGSCNSLSISSNSSKTSIFLLMAVTFMSVKCMMQCRNA